MRGALAVTGETHEQARNSRRGFLRAGGVTAGAGALGVFLAACGSSSEKPTLGGANPNTGAGLGTDKFGKGDVGVLGYLLTLEYLESDFYAKAIASGTLSPRTLAVAKTFGAEEAQHVATLENAIRGLGGSLPPKITGNFQISGDTAFLQTASTLEHTGADAYLDQISRVSSRGVQATIISIHTVEGRHDAAIATLAGTDISPDGAFATPALASDVLTSLTAFVTP